MGRPTDALEGQAGPRRPGLLDGIAVVGIYGLIMLPLRAYLVVANPVLQTTCGPDRAPRWWCWA